MHSGDGVVLGEMRRRGTWRLSGQGNGKKKKKKNLSNGTLGARRWPW